MWGLMGFSCDFHMLSEQIHMEQRAVRAWFRGPKTNIRYLVDRGSMWRFQRQVLIANR